MAHQHYKGTGQMHSFRGLLADGAQDRIRIEGATGEIAWRITKFQAFTNAPGAVSNAEHVLKIYREEASSPGDALVDFNDAALLGAIFLPVKTSEFLHQEHVIFDNALFTRNIYVVHNLAGGAGDCNYYIELEEVKVSAAGMAQLAVAAARRT